MKDATSNYIDKEVRINRLVRLISEGYTYKQLKDDWNEHYGKEKSYKTWERDIAAATAKVKALNDAFVDYSRDLFLTRFDSLYEKALEKDDIKTAADITSKAVKLLGLDTQKVEVSTPQEITIEFK